MAHPSYPGDPRVGWSPSLLAGDRSPEELRAEGAAAEREKIREEMGAAACAKELAGYVIWPKALRDFAATLERP